MNAEFQSIKDLLVKASDKLFVQHHKVQDKDLSDNLFEIMVELDDLTQKFSCLGV